VALGYLAALLVVPVAVVMKRAFEPGLAAVWASVTTPAAISAFWLTILVAAIAVPLNAVFGVLAALVLERSRVRGRGLLDALLDLPFAVSPVVVGLSLVLVYGRGGWLAELPVQILFSVPGIVLATVFVCVPFVAREVAPVLREIGDEAEQAAATLGASAWATFRRVTLPAIRWGLATGIVLSTARALGEFGAVSIVSGRVSGETVTLTLLVEQRFQNFDLAGAYAASALLAAIAVGVLVLMTLMQRRAAA
jgi:sulfate transport system permease protein